MSREGRAAGPATGVDRMTGQHAPDGYRFVETPLARLLVREEARAPVEEAVRAAGTLERWAVGRAQAHLASGRGAVHVVAAPATGGTVADASRWVVRHYRRGGAARFLKDRYLAAGTPRPFAELRAMEAARARGLPVPAAVAGAVYPDGAFYRADLVTELVPDSVDLARLLFGRARPAQADTDRAPTAGPGRDGPDPSVDPLEDPGSPLPRSEALRATGSLLARVAGAGLLHVDLNAANVLLRRSGPGGDIEAWLVDLDRCRILPAGRPADSRRMLARLERSLARLGHSRGRPVPEAELEILRDAVRAVAEARRTGLGRG